MTYPKIIKPDLFRYEQIFLDISVQIEIFMNF